MDRKSVIGVVAAAVVFGAAGFGGGVLVGRATGSGARMVFGANRTAWMNGRNGANRTAGGRGAAAGKVTAKDAESFTISTADGSTRIVYYSASTQFSKVSSATAADISKDETVTAMGSSTSAGDITANNVVIGGGFGGFGGFRGMMGGSGGGSTNGNGNTGGNQGFPQNGDPSGPPPGF